MPCLHTPQKSSDEWRTDIASALVDGTRRSWSRVFKIDLDRERSNNKEREVKKFALLHFGFEKPTPEIMKAWGAWFESIADRTVENVGLRGAREISSAGTKDLPWGMESITGYNIIEAESLDEAEKIAKDNPYIASIRVYEIMSM